MKQKKTGRMNMLMVFMIIVLAVVQLFLLNMDSTSGEMLRKISSDTASIEDENTVLSRQVASASAIALIAKKAKNMGLESASKIISMDLPIPVAFSNNSRL